MVTKKVGLEARLAGQFVPVRGFIACDGDNNFVEGVLDLDEEKEKLNAIYAKDNQRRSDES